MTWPGTFSRAGGGAKDTALVDLLASGDATHPPAWLEVLKLVVAGLVGLLVTAVHTHYQRDRTPTRSLLQAEVLLCVSGALMMIIIGNSTARALGIAGGASIIRFRTPVEDPKDTILLFLLMGLGMSVGLGAFAVCGLGTLFLCGFLAVLDRFGEQKPRSVFLEIIASSPQFPTEHVNEVLRSEVEFFEPVRVLHASEASVRFRVQIAQSASLHHLSDRLMQGGAAGLKSVSWDQPKKAD